MAIFTESTCIDWEVCPPLRCMNEAKYSFLPKFKQEPAMKKYMKDISDAEMLLNSEGIEAKTGIQKGFKIVFRVLDILWNIGSILTLPMCLTIVGIPCHLIQRLYVWAAQTGEEAAMQSQADKVIAKVAQLVKEEKDPKKKKAYQDALENLQKQQKKFNNRDAF